MGRKLKGKEISTLTDWAEHEVQLAIKHNGDEIDDYTKGCYDSALKAFRSLEGDGHSGMSIQYTHYILNRLILGLPLSPITEDDFKDENGNLIKDFDVRSEKTIQCPRYSALFRKEAEDGTVRYDDIDRYTFKISDCYGEWSGRCNFYEEENPITLPYFPSNEHAVIYVEEYLMDVTKSDDWRDVRHFYKVKEADGSVRDVDVWEIEGEDRFRTIDNQELGEMVDKIHYDMFHADCEDCNGDSNMISCKLLDIKRERIYRLEL